MHSLGHIPTCAVCTCVLGDAVQQERVLGDSLHLYRNEVFELKPATQTVALSLLKTHKT